MAIRLALAVAAALSDESPAAATRSEESLLTLSSLGTIRGVVRPRSRVWLRVPFAEPPTSKRRWRPPTTKAPWDGILDGTHFGAACPQPS
eukprot:5281588-Prymnesium_polylepis.1